MTKSTKTTPPEHSSAEYWHNLFSKYSPSHSKDVSAFVAILGCVLEVVHRLWIRYFDDAGYEPLHLLWTLSFLTVYGYSDIVIATLWGVSDETLRGAIWPIITHLNQQLDEVSALISNYIHSSKSLIYDLF
jgi:hypothetical protein